MSEPACFFAGWPGAGPCDGALVRAHLIAAQRIRREVRPGLLERWRTGGFRSRAAMVRELESVVWDPRCWVPMCGGPMGLSGHHGAFDGKRIVVPRARLSVAVEEFAEQYALGWSLEADYGPKES